MTAAPAATMVKAQTISWDADPSCTDKLVAWILGHPTDCHILFHDHTTNVPALSPEDRPSGKNKKDIVAVIARHIFESDSVYANQYTLDAGKFSMSVINHLSILKTKYHEQCAHFNNTGGGVAPGSLSANLLADVLHVFPYYSDLDLIWCGIPSFDSELISSQPNAKHADSFLSLIQNKSAKDPLGDTEGVGDDGELEADVGMTMVDKGKNQDVTMDSTEDMEMAEGDPFYGSDGPAISEDENMGEDPDVGDILVNQVECSSHSEGTAEIHGQNSSAVLPLTHQLKSKTPSWNSCSMFTRSAPYPCPTSKSSSSTSGQRWTPSSISTKLTSAGVHDVITKKVEDLNKESDVFEEESDAHTCHAAMWYNYLICKKELELQRDECSSQIANAEAAFCCEQELKKLDIELKKAEETSFNQQIEMLCLQIQLKNMEQGNPAASSLASSTSQTYGV
ncbi:hypothetical protein EDD17DRAFT_1839924 [Pisolithus thermaeus]|nr:hypothetical protein EV401DRAFT_2077722 [Pisolithus croceorrhizus]KAI6159078.1 hypothetical protein EDD17DRAFT_1839924 [Pisolithus thermaeus]